MGLAVLSGLASGVQGPANAALGRAWGFWRAVALNGAVVAAATAVGMLLSRSGSPNPGRAPLRHMIGGVCGTLVICSAAYVVPRIGAAKFTVGLVLGMLLASILVDHFGWYGQTVRPVSAAKLLGVALVVGGVLLVRATDA